MFALNPKLDAPRLKAAFAQRRRVEIPDFLAPGGAEVLRDHLLAREDWNLVLNAGPKVYEISRSGLAALTPAQREALEQRVLIAARNGFHFRFEAIRVSDFEAERQSTDTPLSRFVQFMSSEAVLDVLQEIIGADDLAFADGQATCFSPGHFLTCHDDDVTVKHRRAAYVFGLQPGWNADWGGLLMFHGADGNIEEAFTPAMGTMRLFGVPAPHSVSVVAPFAPEPRLSVTGWLRSRLPDPAG